MFRSVKTMSANTNVLTSEITYEHYNEWLKIDSQPNLKITAVPRSKTCGKGLEKQTFENGTRGKSKPRTESQDKR